MKRKILIIGATKAGRNAVSQIINRIISQNRGECEFFLFGYEDGDSGSADKYDLHVADAYHRAFYKIKRKLYYIANIDDCKMTAWYALSKLKNKCKDLVFDQVVAVAGRFCFSVVAYKFAIEKNVPLTFVYFDPFVNNAFARNAKQRTLLEKKWLEYATNIFYNEENISPVICEMSMKVLPIKIPIDSQGECSNDDDGHSIVFGGTFYKDIRSPEKLFYLAELLKESKYQINCYSNLVGEPGKPNLLFFSMIDVNAFHIKCNEAVALIYIGNRGGQSKSSKYLEFIAYKKPIIGIQVELDNEVRKYPYYIDMETTDVLRKIEEFRLLDRCSYNQYKTYPDRNPRALFEKLFNVQSHI